MKTRLRLVLADKGTVVHTIRPNESIHDAARVMTEQGVGCLLVLQGGHLIGLVSERDVLVRVVAEGRDPRSVAVTEVMLEAPPVVGSDDTIGDALRLMTDRRTRHLPMIEDSRLVGLVSIGDLTRWMTENLKSEVANLQSYITGSYV
jgi:CBS domain-containing protein